MKIITVNLRRLYAALTVGKITLVCVSLFLFCALALRYVLDTPLYVSSSAEPSKTVIVDAGHGGEDCGAIGKNGVYEKTLNLEIAELLAEELRKNGYNVIMTRTEDKLLYSEDENIKGIRKISDLKNRVKIAEQYPDAIFVSVHMNSYQAEKYSGFQAYFNGADSQSRTLAAAIQKNVKDRLQTDNERAIKDGGELYILKNAPTLTVLLECGFISNSGECEKLCEKEYQKQLCFAIVCGIIEYTDN